jgi:hypothetical protein
MDPYGSDQDLLVWMCFMVNRYMRSYDRLCTLGALKGHRVTLIGAGWDCADISASIENLGQRDAFEVQERVSKTKIVVNMSSFYHESHERPFDAAARGTAFVTAKNSYSEKTFSGCGVLFDDHADIGDICTELLNDTDRLTTMGALGRRLIEDQEGWSHRILDIIEMLEEKCSVDNDFINRVYDLRIDLRSAQNSINLSGPELSAAASVLILINLDQLGASVQFFSQVGGNLSSGTIISIVGDGVIPQDGLIQLAKVLSSHGYTDFMITLKESYSALRMKKL